MALKHPYNIRHRKLRITQAIADYMFVETHAADSPLMEDPDRDYGEPHYDSTKFPDHILVWIGNERFQNDGKKVVDFYYAAIGDNQHLYNWTWLGTSDSKYQRYVRHELILRDDWDSKAEEDKIGTADPNPTEPYTANDWDNDAGTDGGFVLYSVSLAKSTGVKELDSVYVLVEKMYIQIVHLHGTKYDPVFESSYPYRETICLSKEHQASPNNYFPFASAEDGYYYEATPINKHWTNVREIFGFEDGYEEEYTTNINFYWPSIYWTTDILEYEPKEDGAPRGDGPNAKEWVSKWKFMPIISAPYNGPTQATITKTYSKTKPTPDAVDQPMHPEPMRMNGELAGISIPATLHGVILLYETHGTSSVWENGTYKWTWAATNYTTWPETLTISSTVQRFRNGWLKTTTVVNRPYEPTQPTSYLSMI